MSPSITGAILTIPMRLPSAANLHEQWWERHKRIKNQRGIVALAWRSRYPGGFTLPVEVTLVRQSPRPLDDDNLQGAFKGVRDEVAKQLGVDDRDPRVRWLYGQEKGPQAIRIEVHWSESEAKAVQTE